MRRSGRAATKVADLTRGGRYHGRDLQLVGSRELSKKGIAVLAERGQWGKLVEVAGEKEAKRLSKNRGVGVASCSGLFAGSRRGAAFTWDGKRFRIVYFNNIGYLEDEPPK